MCIEEGDVNRVVCPDPECVKKGSEAEEEEVARVVTETELKRWRWLKEKRNIERGIYTFIDWRLGELPPPQIPPSFTVLWRYVKLRFLSLPTSTRNRGGADSGNVPDAPLHFALFAEEPGA